jgi:O-antigen/teichoic acid export membrane protein
MLKVVDTVIAPMISASYHGGRTEELRRRLHKGMFLSTVGAVPLFLFIFLWPDVVLGFFGEDFKGAYNILYILALGQLINAVTGPVGFALLMTGNERTFARVIGASTLLNILCNSVLIPRWHAVGAAVSTTFCTVVLNVALLMAVRRKVLS